jgi:hypothetical protein
MRRFDFSTPRAESLAEFRFGDAEVRIPPPQPASPSLTRTTASDPTTVLLVGFFLIVAIYVQTAMLFGVYTPELFPTEIRLRANGICNTLGRAATVVSPFGVGFLMVHYGPPGVPCTWAI